MDEKTEIENVYQEAEARLEELIIQRKTYIELLIALSSEQGLLILSYIDKAVKSLEDHFDESFSALFSCDKP